MAEKMVRFDEGEGVVLGINSPDDPDIMPSSFLWDGCGQGIEFMDFQYEGYEILDFPAHN